MAKPQHFQNRNGVWQAVLFIPEDVRHVFKKAHFRRSTGHRDINQAQIEGLPWIAEWKKQIQRARFEPDEMLREIQKAKAAPEVPEFEDLPESVRQKVEDSKWTVIEDDGNYKAIETVVDTPRFGKIRVARQWFDGELQNEIVQQFDKLEGIKTLLPESIIEYQRHDGTSHTIKLGTKLTPGEVSKYSDVLRGRTGVPFFQFLDDFANEEYKGKTHSDARSAIKTATLHLPTLDDVTPESVQGWINGETRSRSSVQKQLAFLRAYWKWLQRYKYVRAGPNPFKDVSIPKRLASVQGYVPLELDEILSIRAKCDPEVQDVIDIGRYTGMRISEICAQEGHVMHKGVKCFKVEDAKTKAGNRFIPVAPEIEHIPLKQRGADAIGKRFGRIKTKVLGSDRQKTFHSIRKFCATALEQAGISESIAADLLGHDKKTMTYGVYSGGSSVEQLGLAIGAIREANIKKAHSTTE